MKVVVEETYKVSYRFEQVIEVPDNFMGLSDREQDFILNQRVDIQQSPNFPHAPYDEEYDYDGLDIVAEDKEEESK